ncbi:MAG: dTDP-dihydrostreptose-streptidine-6-phosphate dihydrostreptosyltransferase [Acidimicrobiaceae bacterium]|nr:dTDP-dihydrostreptose-streptidine-6-phosphate dihydrostreptosyltransferase [Acidimicrobiaceae bacterium]
MPPSTETTAAFETFVLEHAMPNPWVVFLTGNLIHVFDHFIHFQPPDLRLLVVVSDMTPDEADTVRSLTSAPVFSIEPRIDSKAVYELLFAVMDQPWAWVDVDCYVLDRSLYDEWDKLNGTAPVAGPFLYGPIPLCAAPLVYFDPQVHRRVEDAIGEPVSPSAYSFVPTAHGREMEAACTYLVTDGQRRALERVLAFERPDIPYPQGGISDVLSDGNESRSHERSARRAAGLDVDHVFFDGLMLYQLLAIAFGMWPAQLRHIPGSKIISPDLVHTGGISYWQQLSPHDARTVSSADGQLPLAAHLDAAVLRRFVFDHPDLDRPKERQQAIDQYLGQMGRTSTELADDLLARLHDAGVDCGPNSPWARIAP